MWALLPWLALFGTQMLLVTSFNTPLATCHPLSCERSMARHLSMPLSSSRLFASFVAVPHSDNDEMAKKAAELQDAKFQGFPTMGAFQSKLTQVRERRV
jgi:hypothetical protein